MRPFSELIGLLEPFCIGAKAKQLECIVNEGKHIKHIGSCFFIGNGGSAAIAAHMAADWQKTAKIPSMCLSDSPMLTALSNDIGYESVYVEQLKMHANMRDLLFAISSSGRSKNILNAAEYASHRNMIVVTLSGFDVDNPLSKIGDYNIHVPSHKYGLVEVAHHAILHHILDRVMDAG